ncbi:CPBP family intramembrane glutamic endopeptidase [Leptothermofonsia sp. ETS-13]|uniref:CPBP family intramembrane glutamic endopeptidase n=1 Tax=Leptothermofonsia sp. ETS-13 TaxID=3035696 RepID=UPI003B9F8879
MSSLYLDAVQQGRNAWWRYLLSLLLIVSFWLILGSLPLIIWLAINHLTKGTLTIPAEDDQILKYVVFSLSFCFLLLGIFLAMTGIHRRRFRTLIRPDATVSSRRIMQGGGVWLLLLVVSYLVEAGVTPARFELTFDPVKWFVFLPLVLIFTPIQTTAEELLFRGYVLQSLSLLTKNRWFLVGLSSLLFGALHLGNPEVGATNSAGWLSLTYIAFGVFLSLITLRDNSLELAIGCHAANNLFLAAIVRDRVSVLDTPAMLTRMVIPDARVEFFPFLVQAVVFYYLFFGKEIPPVAGNQRIGEGGQTVEGARDEGEG